MKPIRTVKECLALANIRRAKRTEPPVRLDKMPEEQARQLWRDRVEPNWMGGKR